MEVVRGYHALTQSLKHPVVTIGNFDGVHLGHQKIIGLAMEQARGCEGVSVAYTFRPHPRLALRPDEGMKLLTTYDEKLELIEELGIDCLIEEPFSREFSTLGPTEFFNEVLLRRISAEAIVVGYDFSFGKGRKGHLSLLESLCKEAGVQLTVVPPQKVDGEVVSSSRIRQKLSEGDVKSANKLLGRPFFYRGVVIRGDQRGRQLGFPTANLRPENKFVIPHGVYATWSKVRGRRYPSVTNLGVRPTFYEPEDAAPVLVEAYLIDQTIDLYGETLEVSFVKRLRDEVKFSGVEPLVAQIRRDVEDARKVLYSPVPAI